MRRLFVAIAALMGLVWLATPASAQVATTISLFTTNDAGPNGFTGVSVAGEPVFLVVEVATQGGNAATGTATYSDNGTQIGTANVSNGIAVFAHLAGTGLHRYTANYSGDGNYQGGATNAVQQSVGGDCAAATGQVLFPGPVMYRNGNWFMRTLLGPGLPASCFNWGGPNMQPVMGDWDGNGTRTIGLFSGGIWYLRNNNTAGPIESTFTWGAPGMIAVVGDWDGNGTDTIGAYRPATGVWYLRNSNTPGPVESTFTWGGGATTVPLSGDWDGDGTDGIGLFNNGAWYQRNKPNGGPIDNSFVWGGANMQPLAGDWDGNGTDTIGAYVPLLGTWYVRNSNSGGGIEGLWPWGGAGDLAATGR